MGIDLLRNATQSASDHRSIKTGGLVVKSSEKRQFGHVHHIGIVVPKVSYDELVRNLCQWFDGDIVDAGQDEPLDIAWTWVPGPGDILLEAVAPRSSQETAITRFLARTGGGLHHVSFETPELSGCAELMNDRGAGTLAHAANHGGWAEFFLDPNIVGGARLHWMQSVESD